MSTKTTPETSVTICDCCGREAQCDNAMKWSVVYRDFQGGAVAGNEFNRDFCHDCSSAVQKCLNELQERKGIAPGAAIPHSAVCCFKDGNQWCAVFGDFINLQESVAGFGPTFNDAIGELHTALQVEKLRAGATP